MSFASSLRSVTAALSCAGVVLAAQTGASRFVLAQVSDPAGRPVVDLGADEFVVKEGGAAREILDVRVADYPLAIVVDNGAAAREDFPAIKAALVRFVERMGPRPMTIVTTAGAPAMLASFEDDRPTLRERLDAVATAAGETGQPLRAAAMAARAIQSTGALFSAIVMTTASPVEVNGTAAAELVAPIVDSRAVLHIVADDRSAGAGGAFLRALAQQTRGDFTAIYAGPSYTPAVERLVTRLTTELMVEYIVPVGSKATDPTIGVRIPGARVRGLGVAPR